LSHEAEPPIPNVLRAGGRIFFVAAVCSQLLRFVRALWSAANRTIPTSARKDREEALGIAT